MSPTKSCGRSRCGRRYRCACGLTADPTHFPVPHCPLPQNEKLLRKEMLTCLKAAQQLDELACMKAYVTAVLDMAPQVLAPWLTATRVATEGAGGW